MKVSEAYRYRFFANNKTLSFIKAASRRFSWLMSGANSAQYANISCAAIEYAMRRERLVSYPTALKVDISPLCNLSCSHCVHAQPAASADKNVYADQHFHSNQKMKLADFRSLLDQVSGKTASVSLYYLGEPLMHPELEGFCEAIRIAGMNSHVSTNFNFNLSDQRIRGLIASGLSHITVCVDGMKQDAYKKTRVNGNIATVLDNLERLLRFRSETSLSYPTVEVQYIKFQHNIDQLAEAQEWCKSRGVDIFVHFFGVYQGYNSVPPEHFRVSEPKAPRLFPLCKWPYLYMTIKYNGDVIPCCGYRHLDQYHKYRDPRALGNVFTDGVHAAWNSPNYRKVRRMVSNPQYINREPEFLTLFCDRCPVLFNTDASSFQFSGDNYRWEDFYQYDAQNKIIRK